MVRQKIQQQRWKIYLIYKCIYELLIDRKYTSITEVPTFQDFVNHFCSENDLVPIHSNLTFIATKNKEPSLIYFIDDESVGIKHLVKIYDLMISKRIKHCILVYENNLTFSAKKYVSTKSKEIQVEFFNHEDLLINKTRHSHAPRYQLVNVSELQKYNINEGEKDNLPKILSSDHISKYFGLKKGDLIKITRSSETVGEYTTFRVCY